MNASAAAEQEQKLRGRVGVVFGLRDVDLAKVSMHAGAFQKHRGYLDVRYLTDLLRRLFSCCSERDGAGHVRPLASARALSMFSQHALVRSDATHGWDDPSRNAPGAVLSRAYEGSCSNALTPMPVEA